MVFKIFKTILFLVWNNCCFELKYFLNSFLQKYIIFKTWNLRNLLYFVWCQLFSPLSWNLLHSFSLLRSSWGSNWEQDLTMWLAKHRSALQILPRSSPSLDYVMQLGTEWTPFSWHYRVPQPGLRHRRFFSKAVIIYFCNSSLLERPQLGLAEQYCHWFITNHPRTTDGLVMSFFF